MKQKKIIGWATIVIVISFFIAGFLIGLLLFPRFIIFEKDYWPKVENCRKEGGLISVINYEGAENNTVMNCVKSETTQIYP